MSIENLAIEDLDRNGLQTRVSLDEATVVEYAEAMRQKAHFPPVTAFCDGEHIYLADGFHRTEAALRCGMRRIRADVNAGSFADALKFALSANSNHGLRRSNADKQRCLQMAWDNRRSLFGENDPTAEWLASTCGIARKTAQDFYSTICNKVTDLTPQRQSASGRKYTVPTRPPVRSSPPPPLRPSAPSRCIHADDDGLCTNGNLRGSKCCRCADFSPLKAGYHIAEDGKPHADGVELDRFFVEIPDRLLPAFRGEALRRIIAALQNVRSDLNRSLEAKEPSLTAVSQRAGIELENAYHELKAAIPFCVCRVCQGNGCRSCSDRGFQTEDQYNRNPKEMKA